MGFYLMKRIQSMIYCENYGLMGREANVDFGREGFNKLG